MDLLPAERSSALRREYFLRLGVVSALVVALLVGVTAVLMLPTYVYLSNTAAAKQAHLANIESTLASSDETGLAARLAALSGDAAILMALGDTPSATGISREALAVPRPGISLSGFSYLPKVGKTPGTFALSGVATTRDSLRQYQLALQGVSFATAADLPVSAYAKDTDIAFTITLTLAP